MKMSDKWQLIRWMRSVSKYLSLFIHNKENQIRFQIIKTTHVDESNTGPIGSGRIRLSGEIRVVEQLTDPTVES